MGKVNFIAPKYITTVKVGDIWESHDKLYEFNGQALVGLEALVAAPPNPVEQFNARRIAAKAKANAEPIGQDDSYWLAKWRDECRQHYLAIAMSAPLPHDTDRHERLMNYRHRGE